MRPDVTNRVAALAMLLGTALLCSATVDRIAVVVDKTVFTEGEMLEDLRLTQFLNRQPLDTSPAARREAAEHLVDQELIRREMELGSFTPPSSAEADDMLRQLRQQNFPNAAAFRAALDRYGITEEQLKQRLLRQLTAIRFTQSRFRVLPGADGQADGADSKDEMETWLKDTRSNSKITFIPEAFQ